MNKREIVAEATTRVSTILKELESEPLVIPIGQAPDSNILAMLGPDVRMHDGANGFRSV